MLVASSSHADMKQLKIGISTGYPPFYFYTEDNEPTGICIDVVNQIGRQLGISITYTTYPWRRMLLSGKHGSVDAIMPLFRTPEREQFLFFPQTGLIDEDNRFFTAASGDSSYTGDLEDVTDKKIVVRDGYSYGPEFDHTQFKNKVIVQETEQLIRMVQSGRVDLGIGNSKVITYTAQKINAIDDIRFLSPPVTVEALFIGFSKETTAPDFVEHFDRLLRKFKETDAYQQIVTSYTGMLQ